MTTYLLVFDPVDGGWEAVTHLLDELPEVADWHVSMTTAIVVVSSSTPAELTVKINDRFPSTRFVLTPIGSQTANGILPVATWKFIRERSLIAS